MAKLCKKSKPRRGRRNNLQNVDTNLLVCVE